MPRNSRFVGESNAYDIANNITYLGDLVYYNPGDNLTGWTLGGATSPTISADGQIDLFDNTNLANQASYCYYTLPNTNGQFFNIFHVKFTKQSDDTSTDSSRFIVAISSTTITPSSGHQLADKVAGTYHPWLNSAGVGVNNLTTFALSASIEVNLDLVMTSKHALILLDNVLYDIIEIGNDGGANLGATPNMDFKGDNKILWLWVRHDAGAVSHFKVRDIRIARCVGQGDLM